MECAAAFLRLRAGDSSNVSQLSSKTYPVLDEKQEECEEKHALNKTSLQILR